MQHLRSAKRVYIRLVEPAEATDLPLILRDRAARRELEQLTERLIEAVIEMMDLADGDPDQEPTGDELEPSGDEFEDSDGI